MKKGIKAISVTMAFVMAIVFLFAGCSGSSKYADNVSMSGMATEEKAYDYNAKMSAEAPASESMFKSEEFDTDGSLADNMEATERKIIRNAALNVQTTEYDKAIEALAELVSRYNGYIQDMSSYGRSIGNDYSTRHSEYVVRIPSSNLDAFLYEKDSIGTVTFANAWQEDVTMSYYDQTSRLTALRAKEERLLAILEKAVKLADIIELENALSETIYEIEAITSSLNRLDNQITYSTVTISIDEVTKPVTVYDAPTTLSERIAHEFTSTLEDVGMFFADFTVSLIGAIPVLVVLAIVAVIVILIVKAVINKSKRKKAASKIAYEQYQKTQQQAPQQTVQEQQAPSNKEKK